MGNAETRGNDLGLVIENSKVEVHEDWNISTGKLHGLSVTVFSAIHPPSSRKRSFMEKALQGSKIYRHPGILRYLDGGIVDKEVIVISEFATPLLLYGIDQMSALQITAGLASVIEAIVFLHDKAGVSHNNVCSSSIYVTADGAWKLWGLEFMCSFGELNRDHIERINQYCSERNIPPDDKSRISPAYQHSRDCYFLGKFIEDVIAPSLIDIQFFEEFLVFIRTKVLHNDWTMRPRLSVFLSQPLFNHEFVKLRHNITNILLLPANERNIFIRSLPDILCKYPEEVVALTYAPLLLQRYFILIASATTFLMPCLLIPKSGTEVDSSSGALFTVPVFKEFIIPLILNLFNVHDLTVRKSLLKHFQHYGHLIPAEVLAKDVLPKMLLGIRDKNDDLVSATLHSLGYLVPLLGADTVVGKHRDQIFSLHEPKNVSTTKIQKIEKKRDNNEVKSANSTFHTNDIPERSSPDGGEVIDEVFARTDSDVTDQMKVDDGWSEWDEMLDPPIEIVGVLQVRTSENERGSLDEGISEEGTKSSEVKDGFLSSMKAKETQRRHSQGLGEEFSIKVEKRRDSELDLFADLVPNLDSKSYDLEMMLIEASDKCKMKGKLPSVSDTLAELGSEGAEEGDAWNDDAAWENSDDKELPNAIFQSPSENKYSFKDRVNSKSSSEYCVKISDSNSNKLTPESEG